MFDNETIALLIPLAPFIIGGVAIWTKHQRKLAEINAASTAEKAAQYASNTARLEERVRVLERIVTDRGHGLADEIEALRDEPLRLDPRATGAEPGKKLQ